MKIEQILLNCVLFDNYNDKFISICKKQGLDPKKHWKKIKSDLENPDVKGYTVNKKGEYIKNKTSER